MSVFTAAKQQISLQQQIEFRSLAAAADRAASNGSRAMCINIVECIYTRLDEAYCKADDRTNT